jgi:hypothetical protein
MGPQLSNQGRWTLEKETSTQPSLGELDHALRGEIERLLLDAGVRHLSTYGWIDANSVDPEFVGHAMWQTDPAISHDYLSLNKRRAGERPSPPKTTEVQQLLAVSGADFDGLMNAARMSIGQLLIQATFLRMRLFGDDRFFDLHHMSSIIYLATASERIREFFVAAAFRKSQRAYQSGKYQGRQRSWYTTPFLEAKETLAKSSPELGNALSKACPLAEEIRQLRDTRNILIHELATSLGRRERRLLDQRHKFAEAKDFNPDSRKTERQEAEQKHSHRIASTISQLSEWYSILVRVSNEVFIVEHKFR